MLLKICYKPNGFYYVKDVMVADFDSCLNTDLTIEADTKLISRPIGKDGALEIPAGHHVLWSQEFIDEGKGVAQHEEDGKFYINNVTYIVPNANGEPSELLTAFTGHAYLCDDSGKTIDVLR